MIIQVLVDTGWFLYTTYIVQSQKKQIGRSQLDTPHCPSMANGGKRWIGKDDTSLHIQHRRGPLKGVDRRAKRQYL